MRHHFEQKKVSDMVKYSTISRFCHTQNNLALHAPPSARQRHKKRRLLDKPPVRIYLINWVVYRPRINRNSTAITANTRSICIKLPMLKTKTPKTHPISRITAIK